MTPEELKRDPNRNYNLWTIDELNKGNAQVGTQACTV
jgi:hypothetical protein